MMIMRNFASPLTMTVMLLRAALPANVVMLASAHRHHAAPPASPDSQGGGSGGDDTSLVLSSRDVNAMLNCDEVELLPQPTAVPQSAPTMMYKADMLEPSPAPSPALSCDDTISNARGHYSTSKAPCTFRFHSASVEQQEHAWVDYHTSDLCLADNAIGDGLVYKEYVTMWPDECVGDFPRCYSLHHHSHVVAPFLCGQHWPIPPGTTHLSVDCSADREVVMQLLLEERERNAMETDKMEWQTTRQAHLTNWMMILVSCSVGVALLSQFVLQPILKHASVLRRGGRHYEEIPHFNIHGRNKPPESMSSRSSSSIEENTAASSSSPSSPSTQNDPDDGGYAHRNISGSGSSDNDDDPTNSASGHLELPTLHSDDDEDGVGADSNINANQNDQVDYAQDGLPTADDEDEEVSRFLSQEDGQEMPEGVTEVELPLAMLQQCNSVLQEYIPITSRVPSSSVSSSQPLAMRTISSISDDTIGTCPSVHASPEAEHHYDDDGYRVDVNVTFASVSPVVVEAETDDIPIVFGTPLPFEPPEDACEVVVLAEAS